MSVIYKCKMCGGELNVVEGQTICTCEYCGSTQTLPSLDNEKKNKLYERANKLRFNNEFDKAYVVYQDIVTDFSDEAEAYWGLVLCKYGIEYVEDPATHKRVPTSHRTSFDSVLDDENFEMVMECSDDETRRIYREEAKQIEEIRKGIIEISNKEEPYDIFICYKETDKNGDRTIDSELAQDVYDKLVGKGYKVFFSRITLEDKLGQEYEPYIFSALNSAKVMLVFGTSYDNYNAVWVKNEWSRFLQLMAKDNNKYLIPCFKNIDAYDIPKEFSKLQAQDMGKVGAIQDLLRGIEKVIGSDKQVVEIKSGNVTSLISEAYKLIGNGEGIKAKEYVNQILAIDPLNYDGLLCGLLLETKCKNINGLKELNAPLDNYTNYKKIVSVCSTADANKVLDINKEIKYRVYLKDADRLSTENDLNHLITKLNEIPDYKDVGELKKKIIEKRDEIVKNNKIKNKKIRNIVIAFTTVVVVAVLVIFLVIQPNAAKKKAVAYVELGNYRDAIAMLESATMTPDNKKLINKYKEIYKTNISESLKNAEVGDLIQMGGYNGENLSWIVIDKSKKDAVLLSYKIVAASTYSVAEDWINNTFLKTAFNSLEANYITKTNGKEKAGLLSEAVITFTNFPKEYLYTTTIQICTGINCTPTEEDFNGWWLKNNYHFEYKYDKVRNTSKENTIYGIRPVVRVEF